MITKRVAAGALAGGVMLSALLPLFVLAFGDFLAANAGSASGVPRSVNLWWAVALGNLSLAMLLTLAVSWAGASSTLGGFRIGATVGFLLWFGIDFVQYGLTNLSNLTATIVDPVLSTIPFGIAGAAIVAVIGRRELAGVR